MAGGSDDDELRVRLLDAAVRVFSRKGYGGTKIMDIVREAGLSTGAVYGRFESKHDLIREAVARRARGNVRTGLEGVDRVADLIEAGAMVTSGPLSDEEAVRLEAFVAARREPELAQALADAQKEWRIVLQPLVDAAVADGSVAPDVDPEAVLYLVRTLNLGLLAQRAAGTAPPDPAAWRALVHRLIESFGRLSQPAAKDSTER